MTQLVITKKRLTGAFYTPKPFVDLAHKYVSDTFGEDWKDKYVVWDCACGTGNLTRDYQFKELYLSTLEQSDLQTMEQMGYNPEATKFQYDFLNDTDDKLPKGLRDAISQGKEILFLINPPYATASNRGSTTGTKIGVSETLLSSSMTSDKWGASSQSLYAQFLYRVTKLQESFNNIKIGIFSPPLFLSGGSYKGFRDNFFKHFGFETGFLFEARHFSDVAKGWGISFTVFDNNPNTNKFNLDLVSYNATFELEITAQKEIYNLDTEKAASEWVREEVKGLKTFDAPQMSRAIALKQDGRGRITETAIGYMLNSSSSVYDNNTLCSMLSSCFSQGNGLSITKDNYLKVTSMFAARKTITPNWVNCKDGYIAPNEQHAEYSQFKNDSIIFSLFNNASEQGSLRQVDYKGKKWDIKNEFFWLSHDEMESLLNG